MNETIDILLATYNGEKYIGEQIESLLNQTYKNIQIIISDDCSTDNTVSIVRKYQIKDKRIVLSVNEKNMGFTKNFEMLCLKANSNLCMFCDQDDIWDLNKIEKLYYHLKNTDAVLSFCDMTVVNQSMKVIEPSFQRYIKRIKQDKKYNDFNLLKIENSISGCVMLVNRNVLKKCLPFPKSKIMVYDWWIGLVASQSGKITYLDEQLQLYRQHGDNSIGALRNKTIPNYDEYRDEIIDFKFKQYSVLYNNLDKFKKDKDFIIDMYKYLNDIKENRKVNKFKILKLYNTESLSRKIKMLFLFSYPNIYKFLYNLKYKIK